MKQHKITIGTISKGFREETYLLKDDVLKLINEMLKEANRRYNYCRNKRSEYYKTETRIAYHDIEFLEELKSKLNGENKK